MRDGEGGKDSRVTSPDIVIIGSGMAGASVAAGLAGSGATILMLERGQQILADGHERDPRSVFGTGHYMPQEQWVDQHGKAFTPGNHYNIGGNSKFYGAVMFRYRAEDFAAMAHEEGVSPAWPFGYAELAPWYDAAEKLYNVRGALGQDPTEPVHASPYPFPPVPDEAPIADVRARLVKAGAKPFSLPLAVDVDEWLKHGNITWDGFPDTRSGKMDAETCGLAAAAKNPGFRLETLALVTRLDAGVDGKIVAVHYRQNGQHHRVAPKVVVLAAGAVQSAVLLLRSGLANKSDQLGRNFMNHNSTALIGVSPNFVNDAVYQKTISMNDWYLSDGQGGFPLGNIQLLGRVTGEILRGQVKLAPGFALDWMARHSVDFLAMTEDLPRADSRVTLDGDRIRLAWTRSNTVAHRRLTSKFKATLRQIGFPIVLTRLFDGRVPSHQCGTTRIGDDPAQSVLNPECRAWDHGNLFVPDAGALPTSAAVNPALTVAAMALRTAANIAKTG